MTMVHYTVEVKSGLLLALPAEAAELHLKPGDKVHIQLAHEIQETLPARSNEGMLAALGVISERQEGHRYTDASDTDSILREGRAGAMWGRESLE